MRNTHKIDCKCCICIGGGNAYLSRHKENCICIRCKKRRNEKIESALGMLGKKHSPETRKKQSKSMIGKHWKCSEEAKLRMGLGLKGVFGDKHPKFGISPKNRKKIKFEVPGQGEVWLRSSWELIVAKYLVAKQVDFRYECRRFILDSKTYLPDFYLIKEDKFIEVKGFVRDIDIKKMEEMKKFYPKVKIEMITRKELDTFKV